MLKFLNTLFNFFFLPLLVVFPSNPGRFPSRNGPLARELEIDAGRNALEAELRQVTSEVRKHEKTNTVLLDRDC